MHRLASRYALQDHMTIIKKKQDKGNEAMKGPAFGRHPSPGAVR
jgi:hypothetical protein